MQEVTHSGTRSSVWQTLRAAVWLEWQARGNWTNPFVFALFLTLRPITAALVLVLMYHAIAGNQTQGAALGFLVVGSAAWTFVEQVMAGLPQAVMADREEYAMLKYVYITPQSFMTFLIGRSGPRMATSLFSFVVTLTLGTLLLGVPIHPLAVNYLLLFGSLALGLLAIVGLGLAFAGLGLVLKRGAWEMPDAVAGAFYLVAGAIFPVAKLPGWLEQIALFVPLTSWLELTRRALLGNDQIFNFPIVATGEVLMRLVITSLASVVIGIATFKIGEHFARERGQLDRTTGM